MATNNVNWQAIADELRKHLPAANIFVDGGGAAPIYIAIVFEDDGRTYFTGDANDTWTIDFYPNIAAVENGEPGDGFDSGLRTEHVDPWLVALNVAAAISRKELEH